MNEMKFKMKMFLNLNSNLWMYSGNYLFCKGHFDEEMIIFFNKSEYTYKADSV